MFPALDVGRPVSAFAVADGDVGDFEAEFAGAEEQVEIAERIEVAEVSAVRDDFFVILGADDLGAAECVFDGLPKEPGEDLAKDFVSTHI